MRTISGSFAGIGFSLVAGLLLFGSQAEAETATTRYPHMAVLDEYLMSRSDEIALARSAAPPSISQDADVLILTPRGYEAATRGTNGFACLVQRSWTAGIDDPDFWNPKVRAPICFNQAAVRSYLPLTIKKTELVLAGRSKIQIAEAITLVTSGISFPKMESGAMCYMMSRQGYLSDPAGHWHPHVMFFAPATDPADWGAGASGSPIVGHRNDVDRVTIFVIPVASWSDGTADAPSPH